MNDIFQMVCTVCLLTTELVDTNYTTNCRQMPNAVFGRFMRKGMGRGIPCQHKYGGESNERVVIPLWIWRKSALGMKISREWVWFEEPRRDNIVNSSCQNWQYEKLYGPCRAIGEGYDIPAATRCLELNFPKLGCIFCVIVAVLCQWKPTW